MARAGSAQAPGGADETWPAAWGAAAASSWGGAAAAAAGAWSWRWNDTDQTISGTDFGKSAILSISSVGICSFTKTISSRGRWLLGCCWLGLDSLGLPPVPSHLCVVLWVWRGRLLAGAEGGKAKAAAELVKDGLALAALEKRKAKKGFPK